MKIKKGFVLRPTLGYTMVIASGEMTGKFNGMIKLNENSVDIWKWIDQGFDRDVIIDIYSIYYKVGKDIATRDVDFVIESMRSAGVLESE